MNLFVQSWMMLLLLLAIHVLSYVVGAMNVSFVSSSAEMVDMGSMEVTCLYDTAMVPVVPGEELSEERKNWLVDGQELDSEHTSIHFHFDRENVSIACEFSCHKSGTYRKAALVYYKRDIRNLVWYVGKDGLHPTDQHSPPVLTWSGSEEPHVWPASLSKHAKGATRYDRLASMQRRIVFLEGACKWQNDFERSLLVYCQGDSKYAWRGRWRAMESYAIRKGGHDWLSVPLWDANVVCEVQHVGKVREFVAYEEGRESESRWRISPKGFFLNPSPSGSKDEEAPLLTWGGLDALVDAWPPTLLPSSANNYVKMGVHKRLRLALINLHLHPTPI